MKSKPNEPQPELGQPATTAAPHGERFVPRWELGFTWDMLSEGQMNRHEGDME